MTTPPNPPPKPWFAWFIPPPAQAVSFVVIALFGAAYAQNPNNEMLMGALIGAFGTAVQYFLGSSKGAQDNRDQLNKAQDHLLAAAAGGAGAGGAAMGVAAPPVAPADVADLPPWERPS